MFEHMTNETVLVTGVPLETPGPQSGSVRTAAGHTL